MTEAADEEKYQWVVRFNPGGKLYTYMYRTVAHMAGVVEVFQEKEGRFPHRMWVVVGDEMHKVDIK